MSQPPIRPPLSAAGAPAPKGLGFITSALASPVSQAEAALRPLSFSDFSGQPKTVERLQVMVEQNA